MCRFEAQRKTFSTGDLLSRERGGPPAPELKTRWSVFKFVKLGSKALNFYRNPHTARSITTSPDTPYTHTTVDPHSPQKTDTHDTLLCAPGSSGLRRQSEATKAVRGSGEATRAGILFLEI